MGYCCTTRTGTFAERSINGVIQNDEVVQCEITFVADRADASAIKILSLFSNSTLGLKDNVSSAFRTVPELEGN